MLDHYPDTFGVQGAKMLDQYSETPNGLWSKLHIRIPNMNIIGSDTPDGQSRHVLVVEWLGVELSIPKTWSSNTQYDILF